MLHAQKIATLFNLFQHSQGRMLSATLLLGLLTALTSAAQAPFVDVSNELDIWTDHTGGYLGAGLSMADFNSDGLDDLSIAHHMGELHFYMGDGVGSEPYSITHVEVKFAHMMGNAQIVQSVAVEVRHTQTLSLIHI